MKPFIPAPVKPVVSMDALKAFDIRVGTISAVSDVANSDRLVRLTMDFGDHRRQIVAGIKAERADANEVRGKPALFVLNLEPKRIRGEPSEGMLLDIGYADGIVPVLAVPEREVPNGAQAG